MSTKLNIGIIGLGVGEAHLKSYKNIPNVEVVSICDIDPEKLKLIADNYDIKGRYNDSKFITEDPNIDVVSICSYDNFHAEQLISCFITSFLNDHIRTSRYFGFNFLIFSFEMI